MQFELFGFDRPNNSGGGTCSEMASSSSFGHSGFTGTLAWADPEHQINYVFLSNRVYQNQDNWKNGLIIHYTNNCWLHDINDHAKNRVQIIKEDPRLIKFL